MRPPTSEFVTYVLSFTVFKLLRIIGQMFALTWSSLYNARWFGMKPKLKAEIWPQKHRSIVWCKMCFHNLEPLGVAQCDRRTVGRADRQNRRESVALLLAAALRQARRIAAS